VASHARPKGRPCSHRRYRLDCAGYDALFEHADGRCQICGITGLETKHGFLVVDHDFLVGEWAVRGLLCSNCNSGLPRNMDRPEVVKFLATPWYQRILDEHGLTAELPPEPPIGTIVQLPRRVMRRTAECWMRTRGVSRLPYRSWMDLHYRFGPMNIEIIQLAKETPDA
jgi:hypothetical protein